MTAQITPQNLLEIINDEHVKIETMTRIVIEKMNRHMILCALRDEKYMEWNVGNDRFVRWHDSIYPPLDKYSKVARTVFENVQQHFHQLGFQVVYRKYTKIAYIIWDHNAELP
jgi:hypothetical protein